MIQSLKLVLALTFLAILMSCQFDKPVETNHDANKILDQSIQQVVINDLGTFACDCSGGYHSRLCLSGLEICLGEQRDTLIHDQYGNPIIYSILDIKGDQYLLTDNEYLYYYGLTIRRFELYSLDPEHFMKLVLELNINTNEENSRENNGEYTHYVNRANIEVLTGDTVKFHIERYTTICPEAVQTCDTILRTSEHIYFPLPLF